MRKDEELRSQLDVSVTSSGLVLAQPKTEPTSKFGSFCRMMSMPRLDVKSGFEPESKFRSESDLTTESAVITKRYNSDLKSAKNFGSDPGLNSELRAESALGNRRHKSLKKLEIIVDEDVSEVESEAATEISTVNSRLNR